MLESERSMYAGVRSVLPARDHSATHPELRCLLKSRRQGSHGRQRHILPVVLQHLLGDFLHKFCTHPISLLFETQTERARELERHAAETAGTVICAFLH